MLKSRGVLSLGFLSFLTACATTPSGAQAGAKPAPQLHARTYTIYVANESSDLISRVRFDGNVAVEEKTIAVGIMPADLDGAHGLTVSPRGDYWFVSLAHGTPFGKVWKFATGVDTLVDSLTVGSFPASMALTPDGSGLFVVNFNLYGRHIPSSVSAVFTPFMRESTRIQTCVMPHGSSITHDGRRHFSTCMMSDQLVEISTEDEEVTRRVLLTPGQERLLPVGDQGAEHAMGGQRCKPTWVAIAPDDSRLYVPCNGHGEIVELDATTLTVTRRFPTGKGPYNAAVSPDGRFLLATLKGAQGLAIIDLGTGAEVRVPTTQPITHGVAISPDSRYAFVSNEAIGAVRGTVDVIDLRTKELVASAQVQYQPGGIAFWQMTGP
ncbi:MAG TPA: YncE family protein [Gemmatimonadales bacterium]|nr:YncE family protein [Gemmatimonadales bacterium]